jgi:hypothetical protein
MACHDNERYLKPSNWDWSELEFTRVLCGQASAIQIQLQGKDDDSRN